jgi:hypothetical protein
VADSAAKPVRHRRRRKHPYRRFLRVLLGSLLAIGLFHLMIYALNKRGSPPAPALAVSDDDTSVQFKKPDSPPTPASAVSGDEDTSVQFK